MAEVLRRRLGLAAVMAVVMGDMLGSGIFFTPGELAKVAHSAWQVYFMWTLCGLIVLAGALTLSELATIFPRAGATYHIISEAFGPMWGFVKAWMEAWVSAPGSIAGIAVVFGQYLQAFVGDESAGAPQLWGIAAIWAFAIINLIGVSWGGRTQVVLTSVKLFGLLALVLGSFLLAEAASTPGAAAAPMDGESTSSLRGFFRFLGLGVAAVFFTYDGWLDVSHVAGEVESPKRNLPLGLGLGVLGILVVYLLVNFAFLRVMPLEVMREEGTTVATALASATFGEVGGLLVSAFIMVSIFGALGGLVMTAPRIVYAPTAEYADRTKEGGLKDALSKLAYVSPRTGVPSAAILFCAILSTVAVLFFGTFDRLVSFIVVPLQLTNVLVVAAVFRLRKRATDDEAYRAPGYPVVPLIFIVVMTALMLNTLYFDPVDTLYGVALTAVGAPVYFWLRHNAKG